MTQEDKERELFLEWHMSKFGFIPFDEGSHPHSETMYRGWKAKADSCPILTEEIIEKMAKTIYDYLTEDDCIWEKDIQSTRLMYIKITKAALAAAGVRFKQKEKL